MNNLKYYIRKFAHIPSYMILFIGDLYSKIIKKFNLSWIYDCDCMTDSNGNIKIIEINPRMSGSLATSLIAGYPIIDNLLRIINNKKPIVKKINKKILVLPYNSLHAENKKNFNF